MIYEWYSGSDSSLEVARTLSDLDRNYDGLPVTERLRRLNALLKLERDPNWRGYFRFRIGLELQADGRKEEAGVAYAAAVDEFDPLAGNIDDVMPQYADTLFHLIADFVEVDTETEKVAEYGLAFLSVMSDSQMGADDQAFALGYLAHAFNIIGYRHEIPLCYRLALTCALRAHHIEADEPAYLKGLIYCYFNVRDAKRCRLAYEMFRQVGPPAEWLAEIDEFMRRRFQEIGGRLDPVS